MGDIRGGISVTFEVTSAIQALRTNRWIMSGFTLGSTLLLLAIFLFFTLRLMRQLRAAQKEIAKMVVTDELTGLSNRRHFFERLEEEVDRASRYDHPLSLIMIDIDHFKRVNDKYGHPVGDVVLAEVARLLAANIRASDVAARYGGEEFAILIPALGAAAASIVAEKLRNIIEVNAIIPEEPELSLTISCGVADVKAVSNGADGLKAALVRAADESLYKAKEGGRNQVVTYRQSVEEQIAFE